MGEAGGRVEARYHCPFSKTLEGFKVFHSCIIIILVVIDVGVGGGLVQIHTTFKNKPPALYFTARQEMLLLE